MHNARNERETGGRRRLFSRDLPKQQIPVGLLSIPHIPSKHPLVAEWLGGNSNHVSPIKFEPDSRSHEIKFHDVTAWSMCTFVLCSKWFFAIELFVVATAAGIFARVLEANVYNRMAAWYFGVRFCVVLVALTAFSQRSSMSGPFYGTAEPSKPSRCIPYLVYNVRRDGPSEDCWKNSKATFF